MRRLFFVLLALLVLAPASAFAQQDDAARRAAAQARRDSLEAEIAQKFLDKLTRDLKLDADQRVRTERVLKASAERRKDLMRASGELRGRIYRALRSDRTTDAEFAVLLRDHEALRVREHDLWRRDQEELASVLTPRQRVHFIISWTHFQETLREIMERSRSDGRRDGR